MTYRSGGAGAGETLTMLGPAFRRAVAVACFAIAPAALAQWNPTAGEWGRTDPADLRVMTWNVEDGICRTAQKVEALNAWTSLALIVAAMQPDVLIMQETGDNSGNGTGSGVDSVADLTTTLELFMHGGASPFPGGTATAFVQKYAPAGYDLPYIYVSSDNDGFNRNVILSRYPFADLNGDTNATIPDFFIRPDAYAPGGDGGIRGFSFAEIDLPDETYAGDLVVGNAHLKAGGGASDLAERLVAAQNTAYFIDYFYNGAGTGAPDPNNKVTDVPAATAVLDAHTPVIVGGDWNEDEGSNGRKGPAEWLTRAATTGGTDGTDFDRSDSVFDIAQDVLTGNDNTQGSSKLDYLGWQDSKATERRSWIFNTASLNATTSPPEFDFLPVSTTVTLSGRASDHRPVLADFQLALAQPACEADLNGDNLVDGADLGLLLGAWGGSGPADLNGSGAIDGADLGLLLGAWGPC
jgi:endonuclease/exonuclease/phosphatase family metal-dependent hydrolase